MSQLFLTNYSIILIKFTPRNLEEDAVYCLGNQSIIRTSPSIPRQRGLFLKLLPRKPHRKRTLLRLGTSRQQRLQTSHRILEAYPSET